MVKYFLMMFAGVPPVDGADVHPPHPRILPHLQLTQVLRAQSYNRGHLSELIGFGWLGNIFVQKFQNIVANFSKTNTVLDQNWSKTC